MMNIDWKTMKMMTMNTMLHRRVNVSWLYLPRDEGTGGIISKQPGLSYCVKKTEKGFNRLLKAMVKEKSGKEYGDNIREEGCG